MSKRSFKRVLLENTKIYEYKIKFCVQPTEEQLRAFLYYVQKYDPIEVTEPVRSIIQKNPLDFPDIENTEVYTMVLKTTLPVSSYVLQQEIKNWLGIPEKFVVVRNKFEPLNIESDYINAENEIRDEVQKNDWNFLSKLSTDQDYRESEQIHNGGEYYSNSSLEDLKKYFTNLRRKVKQGMYPSMGDVHFKLFKNFDDNDFNKHIADAPRTYHYHSEFKYEEKPSKNQIVNPYDDRPYLSRTVQDKDGNQIIIKKELGKIS